MFTLHPLYPKHDANKHVKVPLTCYRLLQSNRLSGGRRSINRLYTAVRPVCRYVTEPMGRKYATFTYLHNSLHVRRPGRLNCVWWVLNMDGIHVTLLLLRILMWFLNFQKSVHPCCMFRKVCAANRAKTRAGQRAMLKCHARPVEPRLRMQLAHQL